MSDISTRTNNASDIGLIVQGTLILLSALVAVGGYYVQGRLKAKERQREIIVAQQERAKQIKLDTLRQKISIFVGPSVQHFLNMQTTIGYLQDWIKSNGYADEYQKYRADEDAAGNTMKRMWGGHWNKRYTLVGKYVEAAIKADPTSDLARIYFRTFTIIVTQYALKIATLINLHGQYLQHWSDKEAWKKRFPGSAGNGLARNLFPTQMVRWAHEFEEIIKQWEKKDYQDLFPVVNPFPANCIMQFTGMISDLREMENAAGVADHAVHHAREEQANSTSASTPKVSKKKYVASSVVGGAIGGGIVAAVVGSKM
jgi:hypothetical protein